MSVSPENFKSDTAPDLTIWRLAFLGVFCLGFIGIGLLFRGLCAGPFTYESAQIDRISYCSIAEFHGKVKLGAYSGMGQAAVSRDLRRYLGWYVYVSESDAVYWVSDLTAPRFKRTIDIYVPFGIDATKLLGVNSSGVIFFRPIKKEKPRADN